MLIIGGLCGAAAVVLTGFSSFVSLRTSAVAQANTRQETAAAQAEGKRAGEAAALAIERSAKLEAEAEAAKARIAVAQKDAAEATARAAEANARAETLKRQQTRRWPDIAAMTTILQSSTGTVEILYLKGDWDSTLLSSALQQVLSNAGWKVSSVTPLSVEELAKGRNTVGWWALESRSFPKDGLISGSQIGLGSAPETVADRSPISILAGALYRGLGAPAIVTNLSEDPSLPEGYFRLVILPR
jgi:hypothetical protein